MNKLYLIERIKDTVTDVDTEGINITDDRSRRDTENFIHKTYVDIFSWAGVFEINVCLENKVAVSNPDDISISSSTDVGLTRISPCNQIIVTFQFTIYLGLLVKIFVEQCQLFILQDAI